MAAVKIRELPEEDRPREKLLKRGADALTNRELIAILLRTGVRTASGTSARLDRLTPCSAPRTATSR